MANDTRIDLDENLDIRAVAGLHATLQQALAAGGPVVLAAAQVRRTDTAALQLLTTFTRSARERALACSWHEPSTALCQAAALLGLSHELGLPAA